MEKGLLLLFQKERPSVFQGKAIEKARKAVTKFASKNCK